MSGHALRFDFTPPSDWGRRCQEQGSLFHSPAWHRVLYQGFAAKTLYVWEMAGDIAFSISIFRAGPFRIGYLGFPIGGALGGQLISKHIDALRDASPPFDLLRIPVSAFGPRFETELTSIAVPETAIVNLKDWDLAQVPKFRRNVSKAKHSKIQSIELRETERSQELYALYHDTILRHAGSLRYTKAYFRALLELSSKQSNVICWVAPAVARIDGFLVAAIDGEIAYYLHGGMNDGLRKHGGSACLFSSAICWAKQNNSRIFNLMSSPPNQHLLVSYKEKMGGITRAHNTYSLPISPLRGNFLNRGFWILKNAKKYLSY